MHANFLLFLTLIFVVICTGYGYVHYVKHSDSSVIRAPLVSVPPRNGSTLEDITDMR